MYGYIYIITNLINNKVYIGQTKRSIKERYYNHIRNAFNYNKHHPLYDAMRLYGLDNFEVKQLDIADSKELLDQKEISFIRQFNSQDSNFGYNIGPGGESNFSGMHHTEKAKLKISIASKNQIWTQERKNKISDAQKGHSNHIQTDAEKLKRSLSLKKAYQEGRHSKITGGWKTAPRTYEQCKDNSERQKGKHWMHNDELKLNCMVFKNNQQTLLKSNWKFGKIKDYNLIKYKNLGI